MLLLPLICSMPAFAAPKPWDTHAIMDLETVSDPQITADGSTVGTRSPGETFTEMPWSRGRI
jgi:hypothetical protein